MAVASEAAFDGEPERVPYVLVPPGLPEPGGRVAGDRPALCDVLVEGVEADDEKRDVDEGERRRGRKSEQDAAGGHRFSKAPARFASVR